MPKKVNRPSKEEIARLNAEYDRKHGFAPRRFQERSEWPDYSEAAHEKLVAEWKRLADPNCVKCGGKGYTVKTSHVLNRVTMSDEAPSIFTSGYKVACSCTKRDEP